MKIAVKIGAAKVLILPDSKNTIPMRQLAILEKISPFGKLLLLIGLILIFSIFTALSGLLIGKFYLGVSLNNLSLLIANPDTDNAVGFVKFFQFINQIGIFILPVVAYSLLVSQSPGKYLRLDHKPTAVSLLITGLLVYSILPFLNYIAEWNQQVNLPDQLSGIEQWMKSKERQAAELTELFLKTNSFGGLAINLLVVAIVPAIGEELLFRGVLLRLFREMTKSYHLAVIISAFLFSAIHFQFYGFLPRFLLGLILGYAFVFSRNLWAPIFLHFVNNASSVIVYYLHYNGYIKISMENFGATPNLVYIIGSLLATIWLMVFLYQKEGQFGT